MGKLIQGRYSRVPSEGEKKQLADERRLFGDYVPIHDPGSVRISIPGTSTANKPKPASAAKSFSVFKPTNTLGTRPSKPAPRPANSNIYSPYFCSKPILETSPTSDHSERPRKKQKTETSKDVIELDDEKTTGPAPSLTKLVSPIRSPVRSPAYQKQRAIPSTSEYWETEKATHPSTLPVKSKKGWVGRVGDDPEEFDVESFVKEATKERKRTTSRNKSKALLPETNAKMGSFMSAMEASMSSRDSGRIDGDGAISESEERRLVQRESPDELQGETTVDDSWRKNAERIVSPSNIRPTSFPAVQKNRKEPRRQSSRESTFSVCLFRYGDDEMTGTMRLIVDRKRVTLSLKPSQNSANAKSYDIKKTISVYYDEKDNLPKLRLKFSKAKDTADSADMIFLTGKDRSRFCLLIKTWWMDKMFSLATPTETIDEPPSRLKRHPLKEISSDKEDKISQTPNQKRVKLSDSLVNGSADRSAETTAPGKMQRIESVCIPRAQDSRVESFDSFSHSHPKAVNSGEAVRIPVKTYKSPRTTVHATRSKTRRQRADIDSDGDVPSESSYGRGQWKRWSKPLLYPKVGKKRAEVEAHDLARLKDGEFLNDNLIELYIRFLEHHLERQHPETFKRMYFFNSFFYASLTNTSRGKKGINYLGVEKWTRSVDIFSRDYVVVPINENAHWYMAIICNLPALFDSAPKKQKSVQETMARDEENASGEHETSNLHTTDDGHETPHSTSSDEQSDIGKDRNLTKSFGSMALSDKTTESPFGVTESPRETELTDKDEWPNDDEYSALISRTKQPAMERSLDEKTSKSKSKKKRGQKHPPLQKYETKQPIIITFDSLGCSRSPTSRTLREYLEEEAKSKRAVDIDVKEVKGMTAKQIPLQPNFSDCGLYLLAYLEKFVQDPDSFVKKLLQREMDAKNDWPNLRSGVLRRRLRGFLDQLYEEESGKQDGPLLVDSKPLNILLVDADADKRKSQSKNCSEASTSSPKPLEAPQASLHKEALRPLADHDGPQGDRRARKVSRPTTPVKGSLSSRGKEAKSDSGLVDITIGTEPPKSPDSLLNDIEAAVWSGSTDRKPQKYKSIVEIPRTPSPEVQSIQRDRSSSERILNSPLLSSPSKRVKRSR
ncbi:predicted protein [Uncinocarpus reesii 1704]|uniref:Ubiquitin-like protease family profile domain-containing protein n=1 Tax=Uncinocarpus reesii (strain UAMH 1704) TaxID=336963 RepID=C4JM37_UNCRE|nr:uncharacterized protein UREG_03895 [Uncinocarpus reesii 1704]EEP79049.1 predicted protein [Uncinocarpus reesii 1704]